MVVSLQACTSEDVAARAGQAAKALRLASRLTRRELAARTGVPQPTLRRFEETGLAPFLTVVRIAEGLGREGAVAGLFAPSKTPPETLPGTLEEALAAERRR